MSNYSSKSKSLPPALSNYNHSKKKSSNNPSVASKSNKSYSSSRHPSKPYRPPSRQSHKFNSPLEALQERSNVYSIDTSVGDKSKIPSPVEPPTVHSKVHSNPNSVTQERPYDEPSLRSELLTEAQDDDDHESDNKLQDLRARLEALVTQGTGPRLSSFGEAKDFDFNETATKEPSIAPTQKTIPRSMHDGPKSIKNYVPSIHQSHYAHIEESPLQHSPSQNEQAHNEHIEIHHHYHHEPPQTIVHDYVSNDHDPHNHHSRSNVPTIIEQSPSNNERSHSHTPSVHEHSRGPSRISDNHSHSAHEHNQHNQHSHTPPVHTHHFHNPSANDNYHNHNYHSRAPSAHSPSVYHNEDDQRQHYEFIQSSNNNDSKDIPPHMIPYINRQPDYRRQSSQLERELIDMIGTAEESEHEMRKVISKLQRKLQNAEKSKESDEDTLRKYQDALRDAEARGMALTTARKEAEIAAANESRRIEGYRYRDGERRRELDHAGDMIRQLQIDLDDAEEEVLFLRNKVHKADIIEAERRGRNQEREKRRKERERERERKMLAAANAAVVTNDHRHPRHQEHLHTRIPSVTTASPEIDRSHSRSNSMYEPRRRPSQRQPRQSFHQHTMSQQGPLYNSSQHPQNVPPVMDNLRAGPYGPAHYQESPNLSTPVAGYDQSSIHPPSTIPDPRLGPYSAPRPERAHELQSFYEPPGWPRRAPTATDAQSTMKNQASPVVSQTAPNGSPIIGMNQPTLGVVNEPSQPDNLNLGSDGNRYRHEQRGSFTEPVHSNEGGYPGTNRIIVEPGKEEARLETQNEMGAGSALGLGMNFNDRMHQSPQSRAQTPVPEINLQPPSLSGTPRPRVFGNNSLEPSGIPLPASEFGGSSNAGYSSPRQPFANPASIALPESRPGSTINIPYQPPPPHQHFPQPPTPQQYQPQHFPQPPTPRQHQPQPFPQPPTPRQHQPQPFPQPPTPQNHPLSHNPHEGFYRPTSTSTIRGARQVPLPMSAMGSPRQDPFEHQIPHPLQEAAARSSLPQVNQQSELQSPILPMSPGLMRSPSIRSTGMSPGLGQTHPLSEAAGRHGNV